MIWKKGLSGWPVRLNRYIVVGLGVFMVDYMTFLALISFFSLNPLVVNPISRTVGAVACFFGHRFLTFQKKELARIASHAGRFVVVFVISYILSQFYLWLFFMVAGIPYQAAKPMAEGFVFLGNFFLLGKWVFV